MAIFHGEFKVERYCTFEVEAESEEEVRRMYANDELDVDIGDEDQHDFNVWEYKEPEDESCL